MEVLENIDKILTVNLSASLAGLSLAVLSFLHPRVGELRKVIGSKTAAKIMEGLDKGQLPEEVEVTDVNEYLNLRRARTLAGYAFFAFILSVGLTFGFDADEQLRPLLEVVDVCSSGGPSALGLSFLVFAAWSIIASDRPPIKLPRIAEAALSILEPKPPAPN